VKSALSQLGELVPLQSQQILGGRPLQTQAYNLAVDTARNLSHDLLHTPPKSIGITGNDLDRRKRDDGPAGNGVEDDFFAFQVDSKEPFLVRSFIPWIERNSLESPWVSSVSDHVDTPVLSSQRDVVPIIGIDVNA